MADRVVLFDYWRSSASYRVRIALNLLGVAYETVPIDLTKAEQSTPEHIFRNPQRRVPVLDIDGLCLTQSLAIIEYLDETRGSHALVPIDAAGRARVRTLSYAIAMDIHPICNLSTVEYVLELRQNDASIRAAWMQKFIGEGLAAFEKLLNDPSTGTFCHGDQPTMADLCLVPQVYNARRWNVDLSACARLRTIVESCAKIDAFRLADPVIARSSQ